MPTDRTFGRYILEIVFRFCLFLIVCFLGFLLAEAMTYFQSDVTKLYTLGAIGVLSQIGALLLLWFWVRVTPLPTKWIENEKWVKDFLERTKE